MNFTRLACLASLTCAFTAQARATILIFDVSLTGNDSSRNLTTSPWNAYGDNVNSLTQTIDSTTATYQQGTAFTPNIQLGYSFFSNAATATGLTAYSNTSGNGFGGNVAYLATSGNNAAFLANPASFYFTFTPDSGYKPIVNSFELGVYSTTSDINVTWNLRQSSTSGTIFDTGTLTLSSNFFRTGTQVGITTAGLSFNGITVLEIVQTGGAAGNLGLDNLNFNQVPEPGTVALVTMGLGLVLFRSRKLFGKRIG